MGLRHFQMPSIALHAFGRVGNALLRANGAGHHLGTTEVTNNILQFLTKGLLPEAVEMEGRHLPADHDLVRFFAGMEV